VADPALALEALAGAALELAAELRTPRPAELGRLFQNFDKKLTAATQTLVAWSRENPGLAGTKI